VLTRTLLSFIHHRTGSITTDEWMSAIDYLTRTGQACTPSRKSLASFRPYSASLPSWSSSTNPPSRERNGEHNFRTVLHRGRTRRSVQSAQLCLSPPHALTAPTVPLGESIASEGKGEYMYVEGRVLDSSGKPVPGAVIETGRRTTRVSKNRSVFRSYCNGGPPYVFHHIH